MSLSCVVLFANHILMFEMQGGDLTRALLKTSVDPEFFFFHKQKNRDR